MNAADRVGLASRRFRRERHLSHCKDDIPGKKYGFFNRQLRTYAPKMRRRLAVLLTNDIKRTPQEDRVSLLLRSSLKTNRLRPNYAISKLDVGVSLTLKTVTRLNLIEIAVDEDFR